MKGEIYGFPFSPPSVVEKKKKLVDLDLEEFSIFDDSLSFLLSEFCT